MRDTPRFSSQRGSATTQMVIVTPALVLVVMLVFQFALWQHATHLASTAAQRGARSAQVERGSASSGRAAAVAVLSGPGSGLISSPTVSVSRTRDRTRVVVRGSVVSLVPGFTFSVRGVADGPSERFRARTER